MKRRISTPKKVALVVLGALTILTLVNFVEATFKQYDHHEPAFHTDVDHDNAFPENSNFEHNFDGDVDFDVDVQFDKEAFKIRIEEKKLEIKNKAESISRQKGLSLSFDVRPTGDLVKEKAFEVREGESVSVDVGDADIRVHTHEQEVANVSIYMKADDMRKAQAYFEEQNYDITYEGSTVYVRTSPEKRNNSWDVSGGAEITIDVAIPATFNADIRTSDGSITMSELEGKVSLHTSDGDVRTKSVSGPSVSIRTSDGDIQTAVLEASEINIRTSDGDITVEDLQGDELLIRTSDGDIKGNSIEGQAAISTSDGDINLTRIEGVELNLRTSDGEIFVDHLTSNVAKVQTSDGNIVLREASGDVTAKTSSGNLQVSLDKATNVYLRTGDGDIYVDAPDSYAAAIYLKGENIQMAPGFGFSGELQENSADGTINGGSGFKLEARTSNGKVMFREN